jgi:PEP-CTERM putative exosortase interaction domain
MPFQASSRSILRVLELLLLSVLAPLGASAQTTFTFTGSVLSNHVDGYQAGDPFTVTLVTKASIPAGYGEAMPGNYLLWLEEAISDPEIFETVFFTGATGSWTRPVVLNPASEDDDGPQSVMSVYRFENGEPWFDIHAYSDGVTHDVFTGLSAAGQRVKGVYLQGSPNLEFDLTPETLPDLNNYFAAVAGTYDLTLRIENPSRIEFEGDQTLEFIIDQLTISAIPEPSTYALLFGLAALGSVVAYRRKRR